MKETTYNKYKREREQLMSIVSKDVQNFVLTRNRIEFDKRLRYLVECMQSYRSIGK